MTVPILWHQDAREIWMVGERDAEHVVDLALHRFRSRMQIEQRRARWVVLGYLESESEPPSMFHVEEVDDDLETLPRHTARYGAVGIRQVVDATDVDDLCVPVVGEPLDKLDIAIATRVHHGLTTAVAERKAVEGFGGCWFRCGVRSDFGLGSVRHRSPRPQDDRLRLDRGRDLGDVHVGAR